MNDDFQFPDFSKDCQSLLSQHLTEEVFHELKNRSTANGFTLEKMIRSGIENQDSGIGVYAGDQDSYHVFRALFQPILKDYHGFDFDDFHKSFSDFDPFQYSDPDPENQFILSTRIRVGRNLADFPLGTIISFDQRNEVESKVGRVLKELEGKFAGSYFALAEIEEEQQEKLIQEHVLFKQGDRFFEFAGLNRDWPDGRGIYFNESKSIILWVNEEDHLRIISMQPGSKIAKTYQELQQLIVALEKGLEFCVDEHLGYITSCPSNLGTAMRASVHIQLPRLSENMKRMEEISERHHLQIRGIHGEHSESVAGIFDISNKRRLGITEMDCISDLNQGVMELIDAEKRESSTS